MDVAKQYNNVVSVYTIPIICPECRESSITHEWDQSTKKIIKNKHGLVPIAAPHRCHASSWHLCPACKTRINFYKIADHNERKLSQLCNVKVDKNKSPCAVCPSRGSDTNSDTLPF